MTAPQSAITVVAEIAPHAVEELRALLAGMNADPGGNELVPFARLPETHYARFVLVDEATGPDGTIYPASLIFMCDFDGSAARYLRRLEGTAGSGLDRIFSHCTGYPSPPATPQARLAFLRARRVRPDAIYVNTIGRTVDQIRQEARLRDAIEAFLDRRPGGWAGCDPADVRTEIQRFVREEGTLAWALQPVPPLGLVYRLGQAIGLVFLPLLLLSLLQVLIVVVPVWLVLIRLRELTDPAPHVKPDPRRTAALADAEDRTPQNQFSAVGYFKPGMLRRLTARAVLLLVNWGVHHLFHRANLAGVKTIHFARWVPLNDRRRMIFASNYDGSLESYMDDFIDKLAWGLNAVFSNGVGYPSTHWLLFGGAKDEGAFKDYLRVHQLHTDVWYAAYPGLTAVNVENNARIRAGLSGDMTPAEAGAWLALL